MDQNAPKTVGARAALALLLAALLSLGGVSAYAEEAAAPVAEAAFAECSSRLSEVRSAIRMLAD